MLDPNTVLVDIRTPEQSQDTINGTIPKGRIPGSVVFPWTSLLRDLAGRFRSADELLAEMEAAGIRRDRFVVLYGRFGIEARHSWLVYSLLGFTSLRVYDLGWAGWAADPTLPIAPLT